MNLTLMFKLKLLSKLFVTKVNQHLIMSAPLLVHVIGASHHHNHHHISLLLSTAEHRPPLDFQRDRFNATCIQRLPVVFSVSTSLSSSVVPPLTR